MLILPLHRPLTRASFPRVTVLLIVINVFVHLVLQSGDGRAWVQASAYHDAHLAAIEQPLYERHLQSPEHDDMRAALQEVPIEYRALWLRMSMQRDHAFRQRLHAGDLFDDADAHAAWARPAGEYAALRARIVTERWAFDAASPRPHQLFGSMFLHGGLDHLLGNMLFLLALGLLVEGPLGAGLFAALYLVSGAGAGLAWLAWHGSGPGSVIGASGAIAGLMGAFCVLWGLRRVRFFYWFFVVFDYVRAPALLLLPAWLGWELLQMLLNDGSRVAYSAHAGGIVAGALLAVAVRRAGWMRAGWFDEQDAAAVDIDALLREALQALGQMRLDDAAVLLERGLEIAPDHVGLRLARLRCARYQRQATVVLAQVEALLASPRLPLEEARMLGSILVEIDDGQYETMDAARLATLVLRLAGAGDAAVAGALLDRLDQTGDAESPRRRLQLAFRLRDAGDEAGMHSALTILAQRWPQSAEAAKARFLLDAAATP
jgi:membrane associated rhomboid family serine protease